VAAHAVAGGSGPHGGAAVLLAVTAAVIGVAALTERASDIRILATLLACGQVAGHLALATAGHSAGQTSNSSAPLMLLMHLVAVAAGAALVCASERLLCALTRVIRHFLVTVRAPIEIMPPAPVVRDHQPLQHFLLIAASISHRGPPACASL
jgi:hypothetical protein